ncbi:MAG: 2-C-methyl-D-erythritol 4-phosphate cytidylyltransferase [Halioglobus sp.]
MTASPDRCWGVIPAAGIGERMAADLPKQYLPLHGSTVLAHSLSALLSCEGIESVVVAVHPDDRRHSNMACLRDSRVKLTHGGATRSESVLAALSALAEKASPADWVLVHDAARPCVSPAHIEALMTTVMANNVGGILAHAVVDTVKRASKNGQVTQTLDRDALWCAQTPQMFRLGLLKSAIEDAQAAGHTVTDEASAMEIAGHPVLLVAGSSSNLKITVPEDLALAEYYLGRDDTVL